MKEKLSLFINLFTFACMGLEKIKFITTNIEARKLFLFSGLFFLALSGVGYLLGAPSLFCLLFFIGGVCMKTLFLIQIFRSPNFRMSFEIYLILTGVILILLSLLFKNIYPVPFLRNLLFYLAIALKVSGVSLLFFYKRK